MSITGEEQADKDSEQADKESEENLGIGSSVARKEDKILLTGQAKFTDDLTEPEMTYVSFVRSKHAHAIVEEIDTSDAEAHSDVVEVFTADDIKLSNGESLGRIPLRAPPFPDAPYPPNAICQPAIADDKARYQGEILAVVVATGRYVAARATDLVEVSYESLDSVVNPTAAIEDEAPTIHESCPDNEAFKGTVGDKDRVDELFDEAAYTVSLKKPNQRLAPTPLEPRAVMATYESSTNQLTFRPTTQIPHAYRRLLSQILSHPENKLDVIAPEMGGGFGARQHPYPEDILVGWCSMQLARPIKWRATRTENQKSENDGRGYDGTWELAVDSDGNILAIKSNIIYDVGAWVARASPALAKHTFDVMTGQYDIPEAYCHITGVITNTSRVDAYRGVTETDPILMLERLIDAAAEETSIDPAEVRRQNLVSEDDFPYYQTATGAVYDSGDYKNTFDVALDMVEYEKYRTRQKQLRKEGRYLGIGIGNWIEKTGLGPSGTANEPRWGYSNINVHPDGEVTLGVGSSNHGQGHETTLAQVAADRLEIPLDKIEVVQNDTTRVSEGVGTYASRTAAVEGGAVTQASDLIFKKAKRIAAYNLDVKHDELEYRNGVFQEAANPGNALSFEDIAHLASLGSDIPDGLEPGLEAHAYYDPDDITWPFGTHIAVVEVNPESGDVTFEDYIVVEDCGTQVNPLIVEGQIHGGTAQGIGQALYEEVHYDKDGNLTTASLQNYALPRATSVPKIEVEHTETQSPHNPHGIKGMGESGAIAAPPAVINAIEDAIRPLDADSLKLPATPERVWRAIHEK